MKKNKKKILIPIISVILILLVLGIIVFNMNKTTTKITLDINPSIELLLHKDKVKKVIPLNDDAEKVIPNKLEGKTFTNALDMITKKLIENEYIRDNEVTIILYSEGELSSKKVEEKVLSSFINQDIKTEVIIISKLTKEDKTLAKKYNITPAKAAYINKVKKGKNIDAKDLVDKSIMELKNTKQTGYYCESGYKLEGNRCLKEVGREKPIDGEICPSGSNEYNGVCYEESNPIVSNEIGCEVDSTLENGKCIRRDEHKAIGECANGDYNSDVDACSEKEYIGDAYQYCRITPGEDLLYNGRCLGRKPTINGGCLGSDQVINGWCYDTSPSSGYAAEWVCPDGTFLSNADGSLKSEDKKCYKEKLVKNVIYKCEEGYKLEGNMCVRVQKYAPEPKIYCSDGYTLTPNRNCLNLNKAVDKVGGKVCSNEHARYENNMCIIYEDIDAKES